MSLFQQHASLLMPNGLSAGFEKQIHQLTDVSSLNTVHHLGYAPFLCRIFPPHSRNPNKNTISIELDLGRNGQ